MISQENKQAMIDDLISILQIKSVIDEENGDRPFGNGIDMALKQMLLISERLGFKTYYDPKGYYGYAEIGEGAELIGILGHVDVVPEGDETLWTFPPYSGTYLDEKIYGRGAQDDKGPIIAVLYAMKWLLDEGLTLRKRYRFIFGTDEENHWRGICRYMHEQEVPCCGFTPDSAFPVVFAEKGLLQLKIESKKGVPYHISGGTSLNAVPESAIYTGDDVVRVSQALKKQGFDFENEGDELIVIGRSAHAAKPESGINAISRLMLAISDESDLIRFLNERIGLTTNGAYIFGNCRDEVSGRLTLNVGKIDMSKYGQSVGIDIRFPVTFSKKFILDAMTRNAEKYHLEITELDYLAPNFVPVSSELIQNLVGAYEAVTGLDGTPLSTGGATYARSMKNCVAFGARLPGMTALAHQTDEHIAVDQLIACMSIYKEAIKRLNDAPAVCPVTSF
ncbi:MAG: succinyl-diaminopimelate desuccinylase [Clostridiales bacterium]|jgi:predicted dipeptidase|nr:succinyl-diaminopimelate desuccinylase [Clostridiales bacterium]MDN5299412.1 succinyl-diaminopimelate desuccinylase [Clostridiales bacterium]